MESVQKTLQALVSGSDAEKTEAIVKLQEDLRAADPAEAIAAIREFLKTGQDAPTGASFSVGEGGGMETSSTLRVALLDMLGQLSREAGTTDALDAAREIFLTKKSPEEWALSLRNLAWHEGTSDELRARFSEMLHYEPWIAAPSAGMAEALDVAVFSRDVNAIPALAEFERLERGSLLKRSAGLVLDRLSEAAPLEVMNFLNAHPDVLADKPRLRADFYTKADLSDRQQRAALDAYLDRPDVTDAEKAKFIAGLAAPGSFTTPALLSPERVGLLKPGRAESLIEAASQWRNSGRYPALDAALANLIARKKGERSYF